MSWSISRLGDIAQIFNGKTPSKNEKRNDGFPILKIKDINSSAEFKGNFDSYVDEEFYRQHSKKKIRAGDTLILNAAHNSSYVGSKQFKACGKVDGVIATGEWLIVRPNPELANETYVNYWLMSKKTRFYIRDLVKGIHLYPKDVERLKIPLPKLDVQKRIAAILDKADAVRRKRQQAIQLSEQFLRSVFLDMFGDPVTNPKGLPTSSLIEVSKKVTDGTHQSPVWSETGIPFLFISNIVNNEISFQVDKYITEKNWLELTKNSPIEEGDVLYTTVGSYGNAALVKENTRFCFQRHIAHIKPIKNIIHPTFLWVMMNSPGIKKQADKQARGIAQKTLNLGELKQFIIFVPPMSKQIDFVNIVTQHKAILDKLIAKSSLANNLFNSLTKQVFSGEPNNQTKVEST